ncbi:hypothetical protein HN51_045726 [Arachis hypogaea]
MPGRIDQHQVLIVARCAGWDGCLPSVRVILVVSPFFVLAPLLMPEAVGGSDHDVNSATILNQAKYIHHLVMEARMY